jgi:HD-like signal output (HDOD) protein
VRRQTGLAVPEDLLQSIMAKERAVVGATVLRRWRLPSMLDEPIVCHHD